MKECFDEAIILEREPIGDLDIRVTFLGKQFGKITAKAKSARKITSKLSAHLEPSFLSKVRFIEKNGTQIVDALKIGRISVGLLDLLRLAKVLHDGEASNKLWNSLKTGELNWPQTLGILGWDPRHAECAICGSSPAVFHIATQEFFCNECGLKPAADEVVYI